MLQVYDRVLTSRSLSTLFGLTTLCLILFFFLGIYETLRMRIMNRLGEKLEEQIAPKLFDLVTTMPLYTSNKSDGLMQLRDFDSIKSFVSGGAILTLFDLPWVPFYLIICFLFHFWVGVAVFAGVLLLVMVTLLSELMTKSNIRKVTNAQSERMAQLEHARRNAEILRSMGMTPAVRENWLKANVLGVIAQRKATDTGATFSSISKILRMILQSFVLGVGAILVVKGEATGGVMIACSVISARALAPIEQAIAHWKLYSVANDAHDRLKQLLNAMPAHNQALQLPAPKQMLEILNLGVIPPGSKTVAVNDISLRLNKGAGLAIIGPSASGKSSLAKAIVGIWEPARGEVKLDGAALNQWHPDILGKHIGYLPQDVALFNGTIAQNISRFEAEPKEADILAAAAVARVHTLITQLPQGYATVIGDNGSGLSQGQRQRIALARAVYKNPFLIVLDEPNANLDKEGEKALAETILNCRMNGSIVIVIDHRHSSIQSLNLIAEMENGRIKRVIEAEKPKQEAPLVPALTSQFNTVGSAA